MIFDIFVALFEEFMWNLVLNFHPEKQIHQHMPKLFQIIFHLIIR